MQQRNFLSVVGVVQSAKICISPLREFLVNMLSLLFQTVLVIKALLAPAVTTIYFKAVTGGNLASSPANSAALTFITTFQLPPLRMERDITIVNNDTSNAISLYIQNLPGETLHADSRPAGRFTAFPIGTLAASAAMTFEMSDASDIYVKGHRVLLSQSLGAELMAKIFWRRRRR